MKRIILAAFFCLAPFCTLTGRPALAAGFSDWAVLIVAGDDHAHSGAPSRVFDNARHDLARAFARIGFSPANIVQFSADPDAGAEADDPGGIATALWNLTARAPGGCLVYFTSHGAPDGILVGSQVLSADTVAPIIGNACGGKPSVIVMSACFSGQFVPALAGPDRMVFTAARFDRTSFGCGESDRYTFFDGCFLSALPASGDFPTAAEKTMACVSQKEQQLGVDLPSEPQLSIGSKVASSLRWK